MKTNQEVAANLRRAKEILQARGRTTGTLFNTATGRCCPLGAVGLAVIGDRLIQELPFTSVYDHFQLSGEAYAETEALSRSVTKTEGLVWTGSPPHCSVYRFNDNYAPLNGDGDQQVLDLFDRAIESLEE